MPSLPDSRIDELFRTALEERASALVPLAVSDEEMTARLLRATSRRRASRQAAFVLLAAALLLGLLLAALAVGGGLVKLGLVSLASPTAIASPSVPATPSSSPSPSASPSLVATIPTADLSIPGRLLVCDDLSYPFRAFYDAQGNPAGSDVGIFDTIAQRLGLQLQIVNARFESWDSAGQAATSGTCDVVVETSDFAPHVGWGGLDQLQGPAMDTIYYLGIGSGPPFQGFMTLYVPAQKSSLTGPMAAALGSIARDGTYERILRRWGLQQSSICPEDMKLDVTYLEMCPNPTTPSPQATPTGSPLGVTGASSEQAELGPLALGDPYASTSSGTLRPFGNVHV